MVSINSVLRRAGRAMRFGVRDHRKVFEHIYDTRYWGDSESVSGAGSSLAQTEQIRAELPKVIERFGIGTLFDAPCGDLHWMREILAKVDIDYIGGDIVPAVVRLAAENNKSDRASFRVFDITSDAFPDADLWLCRDVLFHLANDKIFKALENFASSNVKYILLTTHTDSPVVNRNMVTGDFRQLNMLAAPFNLPAEAVLYRFPDFAPPLPPRDMVLLRREDVAAALAAA